MIYQAELTLSQSLFFVCMHICMRVWRGNYYQNISHLFRSQFLFFFSSFQAVLMWFDPRLSPDIFSFFLQSATFVSTYHSKYHKNLLKCKNNYDLVNLQDSIMFFETIDGEFYLVAPASSLNYSHERLYSVST